MVLTSVIAGCLTDSPAVVSPPQLTSHGALLDARHDLDASSAANLPRASSPRTHLVKLPDELLPNSAPRRWKLIVLHHSATDAGSVASIDAAHRQRTDRSGKPWLGIGYHFVVGNGNGMPDGLIEATFRWRDQIHGAHAGDRRTNDEGIGICLVGDFDQQAPTPRQISATRELIGQLCRRFRISSDHVQLHREVSATRCPGRFFPLERIIYRQESTDESHTAHR